MTVAVPVASVVRVMFPFESAAAPGADSVPQAPAGFGDPVENTTVSPPTGAPEPFLTTADTDEVVFPSAGTVEGLAATTTELGAVWVTLAVPLAPPSASVAVIVHVPAVVEEV